MKEIRRNMRLVGGLIIAAFIVLCAGYAMTVFMQGSQWASASYNTRSGFTRTVRGDITDRNGVVLASNDKDGSRVYLANTAARRALSQVVGDIKGMSGIGVEVLHAGTLTNASTSFWGRVREIFSGEKHEGNSVQITVDAYLQTYAASVFPEGLSGAVCVINYKTGEILCMMSMPNYDPAALGSGDDTQVSDTAFLNRCLQGLYTPGSVFKIVTLASALENDPSVLQKTFSCGGIWNFGDSRVNCAGNTQHGQLTLKNAFSKSCNVTFGKIAYQLGLDRLKATAEKFGFNENFKFGDLVIYNAQFPSVIQTDADLVWSGIGQGTVLTTPLQIAMIAGTIANRGLMMKPYLIRRVTSAEGLSISEGSAVPFRQILSEDTAFTIAECMYEAVRSGTAGKAAISGSIVCGKTGSAEISDDKSVQTNAWFAGFLYDEEHPYAISVVVEQAGAGGTQAAPIAAKVLEYAADSIQ